MKNPKNFIKKYSPKIYELIILFLTGGIIGSIIDTAYRSLYAHHFVHKSYIGEILGIPFPFMPVYAVGLVLVYLVSTYLKEYPIIIRTFLYAAGFTMIEYLAALLITHTLGIKLWDYSDMPYNYQGRIALLHTAYWTILGLTTEKIIRHYKK